MKKKIYKITALLLATALMVMAVALRKAVKKTVTVRIHRLRHPQIIAIQKKQKPLKLTG